MSFRIGFAAAAVVLLAGCAGQHHGASGQASAGGQASAAAARMPVADLRSALERLFGEHAVLAAAATNAALGGRAAEFEAAAAALDANSVDLSKAVGSVYGARAEADFLRLWRTHIGFFVDYATGLGTRDAPRRDRAAARLDGYSEDLAAYLVRANPGFDRAALTALLAEHIGSLRAVIDAQAAGDQARAYALLRVAFGHMGMIADGLAAGIARQFPDRFA